MGGVDGTGGAGSAGPIFGREEIEKLGEETKRTSYIDQGGTETRVSSSTTTDGQHDIEGVDSNAIKGTSASGTAMFEAADESVEMLTQYMTAVMGYHSVQNERQAAGNEAADKLMNASLEAAKDLAKHKTATAAIDMALDLGTAAIQGGFSAYASSINPESAAAGSRMQVRNSLGQSFSAVLSSPKTMIDAARGGVEDVDQAKIDQIKQYASEWRDSARDALQSGDSSVAGAADVMERMTSYPRA
ncbi:MAG: hypothetical protein AAF763_09445 [Pseudomonadota bacterium]